MGTIFKRFFFFFLTNILILAMITIVYRVFGLDHYVTGAGLNYQSLMVYCTIWGFGGAFMSLFLSKFMAKMMYGVKIVKAGDSRFADIVEMTHRHAKLAGIKAPEVGVYESPEPNAFATGHSKKFIISCSFYRIT
jgi:heat shock protein HtpX